MLFNIRRAIMCSPEWGTKEFSPELNSAMASTQDSLLEESKYAVLQHTMPRKRGRPRKITTPYDGDISSAAASERSYYKSKDLDYKPPPAHFRSALKLQKKAASSQISPVVRIGRPKMFTDDKIELFENLMRTDKYAPLWDRGHRGDLGQRKVELYEEAAKEVTQLFNQEVTVQQAQRLFALMKCKKSVETQKFLQQQLHRHRETRSLSENGGDIDPNEFIPDPSSFVESVLNPKTIATDQGTTNHHHQHHQLSSASDDNLQVPPLKIARIHSSGGDVAGYSLPTPSPSIETGSIDEERLQLERDILRLQKLAAQRQVELLELQIQQAKELHEIKLSSLSIRNKINNDDKNETSECEETNDL